MFIFSVENAAIFSTRTLSDQHFGKPNDGVDGCEPFVRDRVCQQLLVVDLQFFKCELAGICKFFDRYYQQIVIVQ